ncbi:MAG: choice-of-anchor J domain-containing protein [Muribaculaceae bacterium]|nr:choice-of-anchor J domain-containing protein [Muribaculaceae bacterium]
MRKTSLLLASLVSLTGLGAASSSSGFQIPSDFDPMNLNYKHTVEKYMEMNNLVQPRQSFSYKVSSNASSSDGQTIEMFVATQSFHKGYTFVYTGGDVEGYPITLHLDGDKVTISNFLNIAAHSSDAVQGSDEDIIGTYDATNNTITIPTPNSADGTVVGYWGAFKNILISGTVTETGVLEPTDELVLNVLGDFNGLTTDQNFGGVNYDTSTGDSWGLNIVYRRFYANGDLETPKFVVFNDSYNMGHTYPDTPIELSYPVVNVSSIDTDYAIDVETEDNAFYVSTSAGICPAKSVMDITVDFSAKEIGEYEGLVTLLYEGAAEEQIEVWLTGEVIPMPDFSPIVSSGDYKFSTSIEYPFDMYELEDGTKVARSTINGATGTSWIAVEFDVPEGEHVGVFSWKGLATNTRYWNPNPSACYVDDATAPVYITSNTASTEDFSNSLRLAPGHHKVRFQYNGYYYSPMAQDGLYIYDLNLTMEEVAAYEVELETPVLRFGNFILHEDYPCEGTQTLVLRNNGYEPLRVLEISFDNDAYSASVPNVEASVLGSISIPIKMHSDNIGKIDGKVTVSTTAGKVTANLYATIYPEPDFMSIVTKGSEYVTSITTDESNPFLVEDGVAYNANSGDPDETVSTSSFTINITIPEGIVGNLSWDGHLYAKVNPDGNTCDFGRIIINQPVNNGMYYLNGEDADASSDLFKESEGWASFLVCLPGNYSITFEYIKDGDGLIVEEDGMYIWNFEIDAVDFPKYGCSPSTDVVDFERPIYVGTDRFITSTVRLRNTGSEPLQVVSCTDDAPFYGNFNPDATASFGNEVLVDVKFYPTEEGEFSGDVTFHTTAGDVVIKCYGKTMSSDGILMIGDVENLGYDWLTYDADGDGSCWNLGSNLWGTDPQWFHGGDNCFGSPSYNPYSGPISPDNWLISPSFVVPADGAMLQWYVSDFSDELYAEHYSVYIAPAEIRENLETLKTLPQQETPIYEETLPEMSYYDWREVNVSLEEYAGRNVCVLFRHHQEEGQYMLRLDDVMVYTMDKWGNITEVEELPVETLKVVMSEVFSLDGKRQSSLLPGVNIVRKTYSDGNVKTSKVIVK